MHDLHPDLIEPWSYPIPHIAEHAQVWHARRFVAWLLSAGAEPRLGTLVTSGTRAMTRWIILLEEQGVEVVDTQSTLDRPLPAPLTQHRGTHFNRTLFLIENLDTITLNASPEEREAHWRTLEGQRGQLKQTATWVVLLVTHPQTLSDMIRWAPRLVESIERVCWVWESHERSVSTPKVRLPTHMRHHLVYHLFCSASASSDPMDHFTLGRIFRCGYPTPPRPAHDRWKWGFKLWRGEARDRIATRFGQVGVTEPLKATISPEDALWALRGRAEAASPARRHQWQERAKDALNAWITDSTCTIPAKLFYGDQTRDERNDLLKGLSDHHILLEDTIQLTESLRAWVLDPSHKRLSVTQLNQIEALIHPKLYPSSHAMLLHTMIAEWLTHAYAAHEDLEGCIRVNQLLYLNPVLWPESRFIATERALDLALFSQDHTEARQLVERLAHLDLDLASPHFAARYLHAKAKQLGALDPSRGTWEAEEASRLENRFGLRSPI